MKTRLILLILILIGPILFLACEDEKDPLLLNAKFDSDKTTVAAGESVVFGDKSSGSPATWDWKFEGGEPATSVLSSPTIVYNNPGTYAVSLRLSNSSGTDEVAQADFITVTYGGLVPGFTADNVLILAGQEVEFTDQTEGIPEGWEWEFTSDKGSMINATGENPVVKFSDIGIYDAKLTVTNPEGSKVISKDDYITVLDPASIQADFVAEQTATYSGGQIAFKDNSTGLATSWSWTFEGGQPATSTEKNPTVTYSQPGKYKVILAASNDQKTSTLEKEAYVVVIPGEGLAAYYPYDGDATDIGPNNLVANTVGVVSFDAPDRKSGMAAVFGGDDVLVIPDTPEMNFDASDFTVAVWVNTTNTSKMMVWQESGAEGSRDNQGWMRLGNNLTSQIIQFAIEDDTGGAFQSVGTTELSGELLDGVWHHIVCVREGLMSSVYVDGVLVKQGNASSIKDVSNDSDFKVGAQEGPVGNYKTFYKGMMDELIIYNKALSADEIRFLHEL